MELRLTVVPADEVPWEHLERVLVARGDGQRCWCQWFRTRREDWVPQDADARERAMRSQAVGEGDGTSGLVAYLADEPVGWVAVAPRAEHARLVEATGGAEEDGVWSITCFVVRAGFDGEGVTEALLDAATDRARSHGAEAVEAYTRVLQVGPAGRDGRGEGGRWGEGGRRPVSRDLLAEAGFVAAEVRGLPRAFRLTF